MSNGSGRFRLITLWFFLTVAAAGLALIIASVGLQTSTLLPIGTAVLGSGAFCFLVVQFWAAGTHAQPTPAAHAVPGRPINFTYNTASITKAAPMAAAPTVQPQEDLVEFELAEPEAPTRLQLPPAFQPEAQAEAEPAPARPWIEQTIMAGTSTTEREFVPAHERRQEIVSGLPLLSQIFSDPTPVKTEASPSQNGKTRGQCGSCGTFLWAPTQRPIRLRCPKCGHVKTLTE